MNIKIDKKSIFGGVSGIAKSLLTVENLKSVKQTFDDGTGLFKKARENAKLTGKILGQFLAHNFHFDSYSVSLIGFSLGSEVIKSCVNTIAKLALPTRSPIQNIYLLGGATYIREKKEGSQRQLLSRAVNGRIKNVHTLNDTTLESF